MAHEVFISYRRIDAAGHARLLHRLLAERFPPRTLFFDHGTLAPGDTFDTRLRSAVANCRVLLALIGPDWFEALRSRSGAAEDDFVRLELAQALQRLAPGAEDGPVEPFMIVPVLLDGTPMPSRDQLPVELQALTRQNALPLEGAEYEYDAHVNRLIEAIAAVPGVPMPRAPATMAATARVEPDKLLALLDRAPQADAARDALIARLGLPESGAPGARRPLIIVVPGRVSDEPPLFVERLRSFMLPRLLKGRACGHPVRFVTVHRSLPLCGPQTRDPQALGRALRDSIAEKLAVPAFDDDAALVSGLSALQIGTLAISLTCHASELLEDASGGEAALRRLLDYWSDFPDAPAGRLIVCVLSVTFDLQRRTGFLARWFASGDDSADRLQAALASVTREAAGRGRVHWRLLDALPLVTAADVRHWTGEVTELGARLRASPNEIDSLVDGEPVPMATIRPKLTSLVGP